MVCETKSKQPKQSWCRNRESNLTTQYGTPVIVSEDKIARTLQPIKLNSSGTYNEAWLQKVIFERPDCLPVAEIDSAYRDLIPVCTELRTEVGRLDILFVTASGRLGLVETKLWRHPEARREVVGQILDYAATISTWQYTTLDNAVRQRTGKSLYEVVSEHRKDIEEAPFIDNVARSLRDGRFLLLVCGDGIREEVKDISDFISKNASLDFSFGLVEMPVFSLGEAEKLLLPRVLARTFTFRRQVLTVESHADVRVSDASKPFTEEGGDSDVARDEAKQFWSKFWAEVDDALSANTKRFGVLKQDRRNWTSFAFEEVELWFTLYFAASKNRVGIFWKEPNETAPQAARQIGDDLIINADELNDAILKSAGADVLIGFEKAFAFHATYLDPSKSEERQKAVEWFARALNSVVSVLGPEIRNRAAEL